MKDYLAPVATYIHLLRLLTGNYTHPYFKVFKHEGEALSLDTDQAAFDNCFSNDFESGLSADYTLEQLREDFVLTGDIKLPAIAVAGDTKATKRNLETVLTILALHNRQLQQWYEDGKTFLALNQSFRNKTEDAQYKSVAFSGFLASHLGLVQTLVTYIQAQPDSKLLPFNLKQGSESEILDQIYSLSANEPDDIPRIKSANLKGAPFNPKAAAANGPSYYDSCLCGLRGENMGLWTIAARLAHARSERKRNRDFLADTVLVSYFEPTVRHEPVGSEAVDSASESDYQEAEEDHFSDTKSVNDWLPERYQPVEPQLKSTISRYLEGQFHNAILQAIINGLRWLKRRLHIRFTQTVLTDGRSENPDCPADRFQYFYDVKILLGLIGGQQRERSLCDSRRSGVSTAANTPATRGDLVEALVTSRDNLANGNQKHHFGPLGYKHSRRWKAVNKALEAADPDSTIRRSIAPEA